MHLVVGATGLLGSYICEHLTKRGKSVRALVRPTASPEKIQTLRSAGVELVLGDLKDPASIRSACEGIETVISTASSTLSRQPGDSIETVDLQGQLSLVQAAKDASVNHFTLVSIPRSPVRHSPLTRAKGKVEAELASSGLPYAILAANYFMEVWLSPMLGFDYINRKAVVFGDGRQLISWVSYKDVGKFAMAAAETPAAHNRILEIGGPEDLSPLEVIHTFEQVGGGRFDVQHVPEEALLAQLEAATDPLTETFCKLQLEYVHGCLMNTSEALQLMPVKQVSVREYAEQASASRVAAV